MPRLPKFKDVHISPLTGPMNSATPLDLLPDKQFRYVKNFRVDGAGRLKRAAGLRPLFDDGNYGVCTDTTKTTQAACIAAGGTWSISNNSDLHDQLGSKESPTNSVTEPITMLYEFESGGGARRLVAASKSRIYALSQRSRNWVIIGDNGGVGYAEGISTKYTTTKFKTAQLGNNIVFTNNYNEPLFWFFDNNPGRDDKNLVQTIPDLGKLKITKSAHVCEYKGFMFLGNLEENSRQQISKVQWSDYIDATSYYPATASLSGQQVVGDFGEAIIGMAVLGDHLMIYKERSIWRCSLVSSANLFVFKQVYQGENTPYYEDTLVAVGDAHFYMAETGIYRITISDIRPVLVDWMYNASGIIYNKGETITKEDDSAGVCSNPAYKTKATCEGASPAGTWTAIQGGIKDNKIVQTGTAAKVAACPSNPPVITTHPAAVSNVNTNPCDASNYTSAVNFTVEATGKEPFSYQWQKKKTADANPAAVGISGATKKDFTITNPQIDDIRALSSADDYQYRCIVTNPSGTSYSNWATTTTASGSYSTNPTFTMQPQSQTLTKGDDLVLECRWCTAASSAVWKKDTDGAGAGGYSDLSHNGTTILIESGFLAPSGSDAGYYYSKLTYKGVTVADNLDKFKLNVVNPAGNTDSSEAVVTVVSAPVETIDTSSGSSEISAGGGFTVIEALALFRDVLPMETVGYQLKRVGNKTVRDSSVSGYSTSERSVLDYKNSKIKKVITHPPFIVRALGGTPDYSFVWYRNTDTSGIEVTAAQAAGSPVNVSVKSVGTSLAVGEKVLWDVDGSTATLEITVAAEAGVTQLTGNLSGADLPAPTGDPALGLTSNRNWNSDKEEIISSFINETCDTTSFSESSVVTTADSETITCNSNSNIAVGQYVSGAGIISGTTVDEIEAGSTMTITLSRAASASSSPTVTLTFTTTTVTCDSSSRIAVGQEVVGGNIQQGTTVATVNEAGAVTSFTLNYPPLDAQSNIKLTFLPEKSFDYYIKTSKTKFRGDTTELSFDVGITDNKETLSGTIGSESLFRCKGFDSAATQASDTSNIFYLNIWSYME